MPTYECDCCGACCRGHLIVEVYEIDLWRQPALVDADVRRGPESPEEIMADLEQEGSCLVIAGGENNPCFFLGPTATILFVFEFLLSALTFFWKNHRFRQTKCRVHYQNT